MAVPKIKSTYSLDPETVARLDALAKSWGVSKSEALRRAIRAADTAMAPGANSSLEAWNELQRSLAITGDKAHAWGRRLQRERRDASRKRGRGT